MPDIVHYFHQTSSSTSAITTSPQPGLRLRRKLPYLQSPRQKWSTTTARSFQNARRRLAALRQRPRLPRLHVRPPRQGTPFLDPFPLDAQGRCALCRSGLRGFDPAYCFGSYEGVLRQLIPLYKYGCVKTWPVRWPICWCALCRATSASTRWRRFPAARRRQWSRGFNQSALLARWLARRTGLPMILGAAPRARHRRTAGLSDSSRRKNVAAAFRVRAPRIRGEWQGGGSAD